jgi:regulatory protein
MTGKPRKTRGQRKATPKYLENAALHYLGRFATSAENLKRVLMRKVENSARAHGTDREEGRECVENLVRRFAASGLIDDRAYAAARATTLHRRGASARAIGMKLREKGVEAAIIAGAVATLAPEGGDAELKAAVNLARRRRLGPFRAPDRKSGNRKVQAKEKAKEREKQMAALARAGFSFDIARKVIDAESADDLDDLIGT